MKHRTTNMMLETRSDHHENKPSEPNPHDVIHAYPAQCKRMEDWEGSDRAWRLLIGVNMANNTLRTLIGNREQETKDELHTEWLESRAGQTRLENQDE